jgi:hypothetical protein
VDGAIAELATRQHGVVARARPSRSMPVTPTWPPTALAATAAADEVGAPVEAALAQTLAGRALAEGGQARPRRG